MGAIKAVYDQTDIEEFWLLQNTVHVKDINLFEITFGMPGMSISYAFNEYENYCGKYVRNHLAALGEIPLARSKFQALYFESNFHLLYRLAAQEKGVGCIDNMFYTDNPENYITEIFGEKRFVEVGTYLDKYRSLDPRYYIGVDVESIRELPGAEDWAPQVVSFEVRGTENIE
jgi:hypothetical protein